MFSDSRNFPENRKQQQVYSGHSFSPSIRSNNIHNPIPKKRMEKLVIHIILASGFGAYIWAIFLNIGTWKADMLFGVAFLFMVVRFIRYCAKTWQEYRKGEIQIKMLRKNIEK